MKLNNRNPYPERVPPNTHGFISRAIGHGWRSFTSSTMLERRNNGEIIKGGGLSARIAKRWVEDLGVSIEKAPSLKVHAVADVEHADMMWEVFENHAASDEAQR